MQRVKQALSLGGISGFWSRSFSIKVHRTESQCGELSSDHHRGQLKEMVDDLEQQQSIEAHTYVRVLHTCGIVKALLEGKRVHEHIVRHGYDQDAFLGNQIFQMYIKCGSTIDAREVLRKFPGQGVVAWTRLIGLYSQTGNCIEALQLYQEMQLEGVMPDGITFITVLNACSSLGFLAEGICIHACIAEASFESDLVVGNSVVNFYGKCGALDEAKATFRSMYQRDVISWTTIIAAYAQHGHCIEALQLFRQMQQDGVVPNSFTFVAILNACASLSAAAEGKLVHALVEESGFQSDVSVSNAIINMYGKCGDLEDAVEVLYEMHDRDVVSWTAMIAAYTRHGHFKHALRMLQEMQLEGVRPNAITFLAALEACGNLEELAAGRLVHASIVESGEDSDIFTANAIMNMYSKCCSLSDAQRVFRTMKEVDVVSWNGMIAAYAQHHEPKAATHLFQQMQLEGVRPDKVTFVNILESCASPATLPQGKHVHSCILESELEADTVVGNAIANMYGKCGSLEDARRVFNRMPQHSVASWTIMIAAYAQDGCSPESVQCFRRMQLDGMQPEKATFVRILSSLVTLEDGKLVHACIAESTCDVDSVVETALISMYSRCGSLKDAETVFVGMVERGLVAYTAMMAAYIESKHCKDALQLFHHVQLEALSVDKIIFSRVLTACDNRAALTDGKLIHACIAEAGYESDALVASALLNMYTACGAVENAQEIFLRMDKQSVVSWTALITGYSHLGRFKDSLRLFRVMELEGVMPDKVTFVTMIDICASIASLQQGKLVHAQLAETGWGSDSVIANALLNMYSKCGSVEAACKVFDKMSSRDVFSWTTIVATYARHGHAAASLQLFQLMQLQGILPDSITFVSILSACSHAGLLHEGRDYLVAMECLEHTLESYSCIADLLGRIGWLDNAEEFISKMPLQPDVAVWMSLLGACQVHGDIERAKRAAERVLELDRHNAAAHVVLSNMYATSSSAAKSEEVKKHKIHNSDCNKAQDDYSYCAGIHSS